MKTLGDKIDINPFYMIQYRVVDNSNEAANIKHYALLGYAGGYDAMLFY